jgi:hypothetical protein
MAQKKELLPDAILLSRTPMKNLLLTNALHAPIITVTLDLGVAAPGEKNCGNLERSRASAQV